MKKISTTLKALVTLLNDGQFHSGSALGEQLSISRNAIWKHINQLSNLGIAIESVQGKGYRLNTPIYLLDESQITTKLDPKINKKMDIFASIPSTNDYLRNQASLNNFHFCLAEHQSAGKGRRGNTWYSPFGANLYLSCLWLPSKDISQLSGLSLLVSLALVKALEHYGVQDLKVKWPNDIVWNAQKLAGILIEMEIESHGLARIIIGIGLNINMLGIADADYPISRAWTSVQQILGQAQDRNALAAQVIKQLMHYLTLFSQKEFAEFIPEWSNFDYLWGKQIQLNQGKDNITGIARGINSQGHLQLEMSDGSLQIITAGEASLIR